ncbi:hypothetical protein [Neptunicella marina]|uniref:Uncharacterized protein n=1 Tax=Neptunicella marina TaxID=2125989 RepID=A0A8J6IT59_9ALTE|nr:hypothetical protein [Neptunicella marina]MBC3765282.1 hypothetical protein [Neptunicella marina]
MKYLSSLLSRFGQVMTATDLVIKLSLLKAIVFFLLCGVNASASSGLTPLPSSARLTLSYAALHTQFVNNLEIIYVTYQEYWPDMLQYLVFSFKHNVNYQQYCQADISALNKYSCSIEQ